MRPISSPYWQRETVSGLLCAGRGDRNAAGDQKSLAALCHELLEQVQRRIVELLTLLLGVTVERAPRTHVAQNVDAPNDVSTIAGRLQVASPHLGLNPVGSRDGS